MSNVLYPDVTVQLDDGNAFAIIAKVRKALRRQVGIEEAEAFQTQAARSKSYDELLQLVMATVDVDVAS